MTTPLRVCFWATTFQADVQALACRLAADERFDVLVALDDPDSYRREAVERVLPFRGSMIPRWRWSTARRLGDFDADVVVLDNHVPPLRIAPRVLVLWHGFGWRLDDVGGQVRALRMHVGDVRTKNDRFRWQAFGQWDRRYRIERSGLAADNVVSLGSAYSDLLLPGAPLRVAFDPSSVADAYRIDVVGRRTVLLGMTWHHGGLFGHWGDDEPMLARLFGWAARRGVNLLVRMHDRQRYDRRYLELLERAVAGQPHVQLKFKSESPDSLVDLLISDVLVSNYSSLCNAFYYTEKPTIHVDPRPPGGAPAVYRTMRFGRVETLRVAPEQAWKLPPTEVGGLRVASFEQLLDGLGQALEQPSCCADAARGFVDRYIERADGATCDRIARFLLGW